MSWNEYVPGQSLLPCPRCSTAVYGPRSIRSGKLAYAMGPIGAHMSQSDAVQTPGLLDDLDTLEVLEAADLEEG